jgi:hypothetical protein
MLSYLQKWMDQLKWQRLTPFEELADMLVKHLERNPELLPDQGSLWCRRGAQWKHSDAINRGRGYKNVRCLPLKAKRMAVTNAEFVELQQAGKAA